MGPLLIVKGLSKRYPVRHGLWGHRHLMAVDDVSLAINAGETLALVGESGSGKSTVGRCILRLEEPDSGQIELDGLQIESVAAGEIRKLRPGMQMVFQEPLESLNPRHPVGKLVAEPLRLHAIVHRSQIRSRVVELFRMVGLESEHMGRYAHELSGGQQQRVGIARAIATNPKLMVLDEPTSALDVSVEAQILNLLKGLQDRLGLAYLFISHDLAVVSMISNRVAVMYLGQIVESGPTADVLRNSGHPYTRALVSATPVDHPGQVKQRISLEGEPTSPIDPPSHCRLTSRCPYHSPICSRKDAELKPFSPDHSTRCIRFQQENVDGKWDWQPG